MFQADHCEPSEFLGDLLLALLEYSIPVIGALQLTASSAVAVAVAVAMHTGKEMKWLMMIAVGFATTSPNL